MAFLVSFNQHIKLTVQIIYETKERGLLNYKVVHYLQEFLKKFFLHHSTKVLIIKEKSNGDEYHHRIV